MSRRRLVEPRLVIATHNRGKLREIAALMAPFGIECVAAPDLGLAEPAETATSFAGNAAIKARAAAEGSGLPALADDSGLEIAALAGAPGVHTADWAETPGGRDFALAMQRAWARIEATGLAPPYPARFVCCLALAWPDGHEEVFLGEVGGHVVWPPRGERGFGYDPMFVAEGYDETFAEIDPALKHRISHRAHAFRRLVAECLDGR